MRYFTKTEIMGLVNTIDAQDNWDTDEMHELVNAAVKESDGELNPADYDDPDKLYDACLEVFGIN